MRWFLLAALVSCSPVGGDFVSDSASDVAAASPDSVVDAAVDAVVDAVPRTRMVAVCIGDSITAGTYLVGGYRTALWTRAVGDGVALTLVGANSGGPAALGEPRHEGVASMYVQNFARVVLPHVSGWSAVPEVAIIHGGTVNVSSVDPGVHSTDATLLQPLVEGLRAAVPGIKIVAVTVSVPSLQADSDAWNASLRTWAAGTSVQVVESHLAAADLLDAVHPNAIGNAKLGAAMWKAVAP